MSQIPSHLQYTESHEWVSVEDNSNARIGITDHAQEALGDLVFVELPAVGDEISQGDPCAVVESVKAASDIYAPISGEIIAVNDALADSPELVNSAPYGEAWFFKIKPSDAAELDKLMDAAAYGASI